MKGRAAQKQTGQVLIQVSLLMVVLLALMSLAVDVGHAYGERRRMQNAADAGALAGAREICFGNEALAESVAMDYAITRNGAQTADVDVQEWTVTVTAHKTVDTFFARVLGFSTVNVAAVAEAACGGADSACGLWPVAFAKWRWEELYDDNHCTETPFYVWHGDNPNNNPDCTIYDCDVPPRDGIDDLVDMQGRAYLDFSDITDPEYPDNCTQSGCGASELACWFLDDSGAKVRIGECLPGLTGSKAGVKDEIESRIGDVVSIPIYDYMGCAGQACSGPNGNTFNLWAFGCVRVRGWEQNLELPRLDGEQPPWKGKVIAVAISCNDEECNTYCGSTVTYPPPPWAVRAVSLIR